MCHHVTKSNYLKNKKTKSFLLHVEHDIFVDRTLRPSRIFTLDLKQVFRTYNNPIKTLYLSRRESVGVFRSFRKGYCSQSNPTWKERDCAMNETQGDKRTTKSVLQRRPTFSRMGGDTGDMVEGVRPRVGCQLYTTSVSTNTKNMGFSVCHSLVSDPTHTTCPL